MKVLRRLFSVLHPPRPVNIEDSSFTISMEDIFHPSENQLMVKDGFLHITTPVKFGDVIWTGNIRSIVMKITNEKSLALILDKNTNIQTNQIIDKIEEDVMVPVGNTQGRVLSPLGEPLDGQEFIQEETAPCLKVKGMDMLKNNNYDNSPRIWTGIKAIDLLYPLAYGQRIAITGVNGAGKTSLAIDIIMQQIMQPESIHCVYVTIGQSKRKVEEAVEMLRKNGALEYTTVIAALDSDPSAIQYLAPFSGMANAEYYRNKGKHALIIFDDLSAHASSFTSISKILYEVPSITRYMHGELLERASFVHPTFGGGSISAICLCNDDSIGEAVSSLVDSSISLDEDKAAEGVWPSIEFSSIASQPLPTYLTGAGRQLALLFKKYLADSREISLHADLTHQFGLPVEDEIRVTLEYREKLLSFLTQKEPLLWEEQTLLLYAALKNDFEDIPLKEVKDFELGLLNFARANRQELLEKLSFNSSLDSLLLEELDRCIEDFVSFSDSSSKDLLDKIMNQDYIPEINPKKL